MKYTSLFLVFSLQYYHMLINLHSVCCCHDASFHFHCVSFLDLRWRGHRRWWLGSQRPPASFVSRQEQADPDPGVTTWPGDHLTPRSSRSQGIALDRSQDRSVADAVPGGLYSKRLLWSSADTRAAGNLQRSARRCARTKEKDIKRTEKQITEYPEEGQRAKVCLDW